MITICHYCESSSLEIIALFNFSSLPFALHLKTFKNISGAALSSGAGRTAPAVWSWHPELRLLSLSQAGAAPYGQWWHLKPRESRAPPQQHRDFGWVCKLCLHLLHTGLWKPRVCLTSQSKLPLEFAVLLITFIPSLFFITHLGTGILLLLSATWQHLRTPQCFGPLPIWLPFSSVQEILLRGMAARCK